MKTFKQFISEIQAHVPIVPVQATKFDLDKEETFNEINKNLATALSVDFSDVLEGFNKARKILSMYRIELPVVSFDDDMKGELKIPFSQKETSGESLHNVTAPFKEKTKAHVFVFKYELVNGVYDVSAEIKNR